MKVDITITATPEEFEVSNMLLAKAIEEVQEKENLRIFFGITLADVASACKFREKLLAAFLGKTAPAPAPGEEV